MKWSADTKSPFHTHGFEITRDWTVFCDGVQLRKVREFDTDAGIAICFALNEQGKPFVDPDNRDQAKMITHRGNIVVRHGTRVIASTRPAPNFTTLTRY